MQNIIEHHSAVGGSGSPGSPNGDRSPNSLQLFVNRFAYRFDTDVRDYIETTILRLASGSIHPVPPAR